MLPYVKSFRCTLDQEYAEGKLPGTSRGCQHRSRPAGTFGAAPACSLSPAALNLATAWRRTRLGTALLFGPAQQGKFSKCAQCTTQIGAHHLLPTRFFPL